MVWPEGRKYTKKHKEKLSKSMKKYYSNPLARKKASNLMRKYFSNPMARKRLSKFKKKQYKENSQLVKKIDKTVTAWWKSHPNIKKERSEALKKLFIKNPDKFKKFMSYGSNPSKLRFKTKQGFLVRSHGEKTIANFLHDNKLSSSYESKSIIFKKEGQVCVPDFYLPKSKTHKATYIEFYGGYPKSWKKKVMKNRLYKSHKIPCIFITPAELRNLKYYLLKEIRERCKKGRSIII